MQQTIRALMLGVAMVALVVACGSFVLLRTLQQTGGDSSEPVAFTVEQGDSTSKIAARLSESGLIHQPLLFTLLARGRGLDDKLQAGTYALRPNMTMGEIMGALQTARSAETQVTIIEGSRLEEIGQALEAKGVASSEEFLAVARNGDAFKDKHFLLSALPPGASLEGYLFPDTYRIAGSASVTDVVELMLGTFDRKYAGFEKQIQVSNRNVHEIVTMASIIQREAALPSEMPQIAGVFWNRLAPEHAAETGDGKLQADPTVQYALGKPGDWWPKLNQMSADAINGVSSPYNTRANAGLPPGPISSPGLTALEAAAKPATDPPYLYFVASCAKDGSHKFASDFAQFQQFEQEFLACQ